jgi:mRNA-degrading endonuclease RelE of RelBE toxin-antitoxin system
MYWITFTYSAMDDLAYYGKGAQKLILDQVAAQRTYQPSIRTRNRKLLRHTYVSDWEVRIGQYRVFYSIDEAARAVEIRMIGHKEGNRLFVRGKEYQL